MPNKKVVMIGGGTGTFAVLSGLKNYSELDLSAIVAVTDSGGSTGVLRDEFGYLPIGDIRQCIVALAQEVKATGVMRELFNYRFQKGGNGLEGHSFGNLFLTALTEISGGDQLQAIALASKILRIKGQVIPVSLDNIDLAVQQADGTVTIGETHIKDRYQRRNIESRIVKAWLQPVAQATPAALQAIREADMVLIGPGGLFTSLVANLLVSGVAAELRRMKGRILYTVNLMTDAGQTFGLSAQDHVETIREYIGRYPDNVLINDRPLPSRILRRYEQVNDYLVADDLEDNANYQIIRTDLVSRGYQLQQRKDFAIKRSFIRHNGELVARVVRELLISS